MTEPLTGYSAWEDLVSGLPTLAAAPSDVGQVELIVVRPEEGSRLTPQSAVIDRENGVVGDRWSLGNDPNPEAQVTLINSSVLRLLTPEKERWAEAGDNLVVSLNLGHDTLAAHDRLRIGDVVVEVSEQPHTGCSKFAHRFGRDALRFVNQGEGKRLRMRGVNTRVVTGGTIEVGDRIAVIRDGHGSHGGDT